MIKLQCSCVRRFDKILRDLRLARKLVIKNQTVAATRELGSAVSELGKASLCIRSTPKGPKGPKKPNEK